MADGQRKIAVFLLLPIGDTLFTTPALHAIRLANPDAIIHALVFPSNRAILEANPDVDALINYPTGEDWAQQWGVRRLFALYWWMNRQRYDLVVEFCPAIRWLTFIVNPPQIPPKKRVHIPFPWLWWLAPGTARQRWWRRHHAVQIYNRIVEAGLGLKVRQDRLRLKLRDKDYQAAHAVLTAHGANPNRQRIIAIHPGGEGVSGLKRWPTACFAALADQLIERHDVHIALLGGHDDQELNREVIAQARRHERILNLAGQTGLLASAALIAQSKLFIGNDSSPLHIATAVGTPVVGIYGPTNLYNYRPYLPLEERGHTWQVVTPPDYQASSFFLGGQPFWRKHDDRSGRIGSITTEAVLAAAEEIMNCELCYTFITSKTDKGATWIRKVCTRRRRWITGYAS
jgi:ADP-heptose:LPS heptosyltransferase